MYGIFPVVALLREQTKYFIYLRCIIMFIFCFLINIIIVVKSFLGRKMMNNVKKNDSKIQLLHTIKHYEFYYCTLHIQLLQTIQHTEANKKALKLSLKEPETKYCQNDCTMHKSRLWAVKQNKKTHSLYFNYYRVFQMNE